jgi:mRNA interferase MazF
MIPWGVLFEKEWKTKNEREKRSILKYIEGDIIKINFSSSKGHEQKGYRPGLVISDPVTQKALNGLVTIVPITNSISTFFTRVNLDKYNIRTKGDILMDQIKVLDLSEREYEYIEKAPKDVLSKCNIIFNAIYEKLLNS